MGVATIIVPEEKIEDFDVFVNGKSIAQADPEMLATLAKKAGVNPLDNYCQLWPDVYDDFGLDEETLRELKAHDNVPDSIEDIKWFSAKDGIVTVLGLKRKIESNKNSIEDSEEIIGELNEYYAVLKELDKRGVRFCLTLAM